MICGRTILLGIVVAVTLSAVVACSKTPPPPTQIQKNLEIDSVLMQVNPFVANMEFQIRTNKVAMCMVYRGMAETLANPQKGSGKSANEVVVKRILTEQQGFCRVYEAADEGSRSTFNEVRTRHQMLSQQFAFSVFEQTEDGENETFSEEEIGIFSSLEACAKVEQIARDYGIPTRKCHLWTVH